MKKNINLKVITILFIALGLFSCSEKENKVKKIKKENIVNVSTITATNQSFTNYLPIVGTVKSVNKAMLSSQEGGIIKEVMKEKGDFVEKGEIILIVDNDVLHANLNAAKAQYDLAEITFEKQEMIHKENVNSEFQYLQSKYNKDQAKANYEMVKARFEKTFIKAPFSGIIAAQYIEVGEFAMPGAPIVNLISTNSKIEAGIPERYSGKIKLNSKVRIVFKDLSSEVYKGKISFVGPIVDPTNRTFPIEISFNSKNVKVKPELVAEVSILLNSYESVITVPDEIISRSDNGYTIFVVEDSIAVAKDIEIINRVGSKVAINSGINSGDQIIVIGYQGLVSGQKVRIVN